MYDREVEGGASSGEISICEHLSRGACLPSPLPPCCLPASLPPSCLPNSLPTPPHAWCLVRAWEGMQHPGGRWSAPPSPNPVLSSYNKALNVKSQSHRDHDIGTHRCQILGKPLPQLLYPAHLFATLIQSLQT